MKKALTTVLMLVALTLVFGQTILYYWNFNAGAPATDQTWAQPIPATLGNANLTYTFTEAFSFGGTTINGIDGEVNGGTFAPRGGASLVNNGAYFTMMGSTVGYDNISLSYPVRKTSTGFNSVEAQYTLDGSTWLTKETIDISSYTSSTFTEAQIVHVDFNSVPGTANNANFGIRIVLTGCSSDVGNNRIDNIRISGALQGGVATPVFDPAGGYYVQPVNVAISTSTPGASIRYTTNGTEPTDASTLYTTPINIATTTTLKAKAFATGMVNSVTATATYSFATVVSDLTELRQMPTGDAVYFLPNPVILTCKVGAHKYVQDAGAGIYIYDTAGIVPNSYNVGDGISGFTGKLTAYFETLEFIPVSNPGPATSTGNTIPIPTVTIAQLNSDIGVYMYQSRLVRINQVHFDAPSGNFIPSVSTTYGISDATGSMSFRTAFWDADYMNGSTPIPTGNFNLLGIIAHFQSTAQITARSIADLNAPPVSNEDEVVVPVGANLIGNYPNPFNPNTNISFSLDKSAPAQVTIYNQKGQMVKSFDMPTAKQGVTTLDWNGTDNHGNSVSSGIYYFRLKSGSYSSTKKMVLMK